MSLLRDLLSAHLLRFDRVERPPLDPAAGTRLFALFVVVGLILQPGLRFMSRAVGRGKPWIALAIILVLIAAVVVGVRRWVRLDLGAIGLRAWAAWTARERIYLLTVAPLAAVAFSILFRAHLARLAAAHGWAGFFLFSVLTGILWGVAQEFIYRGLLQTELVRRFGAVAGVLLANLVFTFGPLHFEYFGLGQGGAPRWSMFGAIFGIGLLFGVLYRRSGNLWIPALLHGLWPPNMT